MFRDTTNYKMDLTHFSIGSVFVAEPQCCYLVISKPDEPEDLGQLLVGLLDLTTFKEVPGSVTVLDPNLLSVDEARRLVSLLGAYAFSDCTLSPKGLKTANDNFKY